MEYIFKIDISTDGDFSFPYVPRGMDYYPTNGTYSLEKSYDDQEVAIQDIVSICTFLKEQMYTSRNWVRDYFNTCIDSFMRHVHENDYNTNHYISEYMSGNYDGTEFVFCVQPHRYNFSLNLTDEEAELIRKNGKLVSIGQVKDAVLGLFKQ
jgi:hypothetical protein